MECAIVTKKIKQEFDFNRFELSPGRIFSCTRVFCFVDRPHCSRARARALGFHRPATAAALNRQRAALAACHLSEIREQVNKNKAQSQTSNSCHSPLVDVGVFAI